MVKMIIPIGYKQKYTKILLIISNSYRNILKAEFTGVFVIYALKLLSLFLNFNILFLF